MNRPSAFAAQTVVTSSPLSPDEMPPTCFLPLLSMTPFGLYTVLVPVSSAFHI